jgi:hypothetical protein
MCRGAGPGIPGFLRTRRRYPPVIPSSSAHEACQSAPGADDDALTCNQEVGSAPASAVITQSGS